MTNRFNWYMQEKFLTYVILNPFMVGETWKDHVQNKIYEGIHGSHSKNAAFKGLLAVK